VKAAGDITTRVAVLEVRHEDLLDLLEVKFEQFEWKLSSVAASSKWMLRTMIGLLVTVAGGLALILLKG